MQYRNSGYSGGPWLGSDGVVVGLWCERRGAPVGIGMVGTVPGGVEGWRRQLDVTGQKTSAK